MRVSVFGLHVDNNGNILYSPEDQKKLDFTDIVRSYLLEQGNIFLNALAFGKETDAKEKINLITHLGFYLGIMFQERRENEILGTIYDDNYYRTEYSIDCIIRYLICKNIPGLLIQQIIDLYFNETALGVGTMEIEGTDIPFKIS